MVRSRACHGFTDLGTRASVSKNHDMPSSGPCKAIIDNITEFLILKNKSHYTFWSKTL